MDFTLGKILLEVVTLFIRVSLVLNWFGIHVWYKPKYNFVNFAGKSNGPPWYITVSYLSNALFLLFFCIVHNGESWRCLGIINMLRRFTTFENYLYSFKIFMHFLFWTVICTVPLFFLILNVYCCLICLFFIFSVFCRYVVQTLYYLTSLSIFTILVVLCDLSIRQLYNV